MGRRSLSSHGGRDNRERVAAGSGAKLMRAGGPSIS